MAFPVYRCEEWQCRYVFEDKRCCGLNLGHEGDHMPVEARAPHEPPAARTLARLRHAYEQAVNGFVGDWKDFANGLIAPCIRELEAQEARPAPPLDWQRFRDAFRLLYTDIEDFYNIGDMSDSARGLAARRIEQFAELFNEAMRPDPALPSPPAAPK